MKYIKIVLLSFFVTVGILHFGWVIWYKINPPQVSPYLLTQNELLWRMDAMKEKDIIPFSGITPVEEKYFILMRIPKDKFDQVVEEQKTESEIEI